VELTRAGKTQTIPVKLGEMPAEQGARSKRCPDLSRQADPLRSAQTVSNRRASSIVPLKRATLWRIAAREVAPRRGHSTFVTRGISLATAGHMQPSSYSDILRRVRELAPFPDDSSAEAALSVVIEALGAMLTRDEQNALSLAVPDELARMLRRAEPWTQSTTRDFFKTVAARRGVSLSHAIEQAVVVCRAVGEVLTPSARGRLARTVPALASIMQPPQEYGKPPPHSGLGERAHDLAEGRPGAEHPLASSDLQRLAHEHSVARSNDPHAETKLSSACGLTQEREARTLATGEPGSRRSLARSH